MGVAAVERGLDPGACLRAALAGALTGIVGGVYRLTLDGADTWQRELIARLGRVPLGWLALAALCAAGAAMARSLTMRVAPEAAGSGIPHVEEVLEGGAPMRWQRLLPVKFVAGALALASGLSLGREGPTVHMGAALATATGSALAGPTGRALLAAGAGAGLTAAFSAPLAGLVFVLEELRRAPSLLTASTAFTAVLVSHLAVTVLVGSGPMFALPAGPAPPLDLLPLFVALGVAAGLLGVVFNRGLLATLSGFEAVRRAPSPLRAAAVGVLAALVACWVPAASGSGERMAGALIEGGIGASLAGLVLLLAAKLVLTLASYGCGVPGGIFAPQLALGATLGAIVERIAPDPGGGLLPALATAGMAGVFAGSVRAPVTGLVLVVELTQGDHLLVQQATAALVAYLVAAGLHDRPVYEALRERDARRDGGALDLP